MKSAIWISHLSSFHVNSWSSARLAILQPTYPLNVDFIYGWSLRVSVRPSGRCDVIRQILQEQSTNLTSPRGDATNLVTRRRDGNRERGGENLQSRERRRDSDLPIRPSVSLHVLQLQLGEWESLGQSYRVERRCSLEIWI